MLPDLLNKRIGDEKTLYSLRKVNSILYLFTFITIAITIWVQNLGALLFSYGILGAIIAFALQDVFKSFIGGITIFFSGVYRVGDRIEIKSKVGDVIDIGLLYTTILETNEWVKGDQPTGRLSVIPNSLVLSEIADNYNKDHPFVWDEILVPVTYDSDWKAALRLLEDIAESETREYTQMSEASLSVLSRKYFLPSNPGGARIFVTITDNWIALHVRYITEVRQRRIVKDNLSRKILTEFERHEKIKIASQTMNITVFKPGQPSGGV